MRGPPAELAGLRVAPGHVHRPRRRRAAHGRAAAGRVQVDEAALEAARRLSSRVVRRRRSGLVVVMLGVVRRRRRRKAAAAHHPGVGGERLPERGWAPRGTVMRGLVGATFGAAAAAPAGPGRGAAAAAPAAAAVLPLAELGERAAEEVGGGADAGVAAAVDVAGDGAGDALVAPAPGVVQPVDERDRVRGRPGRADRAAPGPDRPHAPRAARAGAAAVRVHGRVVVERRPVVAHLSRVRMVGVMSGLFIYLCRYIYIYAVVVIVKRVVRGGGGPGGRRFRGYMRVWVCMYVRSAVNEVVCSGIGRTRVRLVTRPESSRTTYR